MIDFPGGGFGQKTYRRVSTLYIFYAVIAWKKNFDRATKSFPTKKMLVMGKTRI
jgi:hypothetical protein